VEILAQIGVKKNEVAFPFAEARTGSDTGVGVEVVGATFAAVGRGDDGAQDSEWP
jgi:hypothetical protein